MAFNLASGAAAAEMGQMINADLQEKQADVALKKQSLAEHQMAMQMQQQNQAKQQQYNAAMKNTIDTADASDKADKIANGTAPNPDAVDGAQKAATQYKSMAKVAFDYGQTDKGIELLKLADSERDKAGSEAKKNLEAMEKQNDLGGRVASAFVEGDISPQDYFKQYAEIHGVKAAMALPADPEKLKAFAKAEIIKGESTSEHLNQGIRIAEADQNRREKAREFQEREKDRAEERADRAMMREAILAQKKEKEEKQTKLSDDALNQAAYEKLFTGKEMSGMGNASADERIKARNREAEIIHSLGLTPSEAALLPTDTKAKGKALTGLTNWGAFVEKSQKQLDGSIDLAISTSAKLSRTDIQTLNKAILAGEKEFGSGPAAAYAKQINTWRTEYARLMSGPTSNGMLHVDAEKKADELISQVSSPDQLKALKESTRQEAKITNDAIRSQIDEMHKSMNDPTSNRASGGDKPSVSNW
jgi:hypothetical protein